MTLPHAPSKKHLSLRVMENRARKFVADWQGETRENAEAQPCAQSTGSSSHGIGTQIDSHLAGAKAEISA